MPYRYKTKFYRIPVMGAGDMLTEEQEWVQMSIIDNLLYTSNFGCTKAFLEEGSYSLMWDSSHSECKLIIKPSTQDGFSLMGIINGRMFCSGETLSVGILYPDSRYHVYVEYNSMLESDMTGFSLLAYIHPEEENEMRMKLCVVDTHGDGSINLDVNKIYAKNLLSHTMDSTNPHGRTLSQDVMNVAQRLTVAGSDVNGSVYSEVLSKGNGGFSEVEVDGGRELLFVTATPMELGAGEIACRIDGSTVIVSNSGKAGIPIRLRIDVK